MTNKKKQNDQKSHKAVSHKKGFYKQNFKKLMIIPMILFVLAIFSIVSTYQSEGSPIYRDITLKGGLSAVISIDTDLTVLQLEEKIEEIYPDKSFAISTLTDGGVDTGFIIDILSIFKYANSWT